MYHILSREWALNVYTTGHAAILNFAIKGKSLHNSEAATEGVLYKKVVLNNFAIFTGKHLSWSLFFKKIVVLKACDFIKKRLQNRCFPVNIAQFLRIPFLKNICERLLLMIDFLVSLSKLQTQAV